jgi:hypothetical protein
VVFLFAARVALAAPAGLAAPLAALAAAALAVELAVDGSAPASSPLRRFRTRCADVTPVSFRAISPVPLLNWAGSLCDLICCGRYGAV